ncbi:uncharacterized mitochondrial protein-like protein [Tanacetum coccineum]|uniref:Uncharacterized mitochondrial protein-like protein n=1 Tax=Tanacetum coccineum TaxID=301880 RepID=A0ABQ5G194_9ASTR
MDLISLYQLPFCYWKLSTFVLETWFSSSNPLSPPIPRILGTTNDGLNVTYGFFAKIRIHRGKYKLEMADTQAEIHFSQGLPRKILQQTLNQTRHCQMESLDNVERCLCKDQVRYQTRKEDLFVEYERFRCYWKRINSDDYFGVSNKLVIDMMITQLNIPTHQLDTSCQLLPVYWGTFVTNVKQNMDISNHHLMFRSISSQSLRASCQKDSQETREHVYKNLLIHWPIVAPHHICTALFIHPQLLVLNLCSVPVMNDALMATMTQIAKSLMGFPKKQFTHNNNQPQDFRQLKDSCYVTCMVSLFTLNPFQWKLQVIVGNTGTRGKEGVMYTARRKVDRVFARQYAPGRTNLASDAETEIDDNAIPFSSYLLDNEAQNIDDTSGRNVSLENDGMMTGKANTHSRTANTEKLSALTAELKAGKPRVTVVKKVVDLSTSETRQIACSRNVQLRFTHNNSDCQAVLGSKGISLVVQRLFYGYLDSGCSRTYDPVDSARLINFVEKLLVPLKIWHDEYCIGSLASLLKNDFCAKSTELETYCFYSQGRRPVLPCIRTPEPTCVLPYKEKQVARFVSRLPMVHLPQQLFRRALLAVTENLLPHQYSLQTLHPKDLLIPEHPSHVYRLQEKLSMDSNSAPPVDDGDNMSFFLGLQISQNPPRHLYAYQSKYAQEILKKFGFDSCSPIDTPMAERPNLDEDKGGKLIDPTRFRGMVGLLMFLMCSRPDIVFALAGPPKKRRKGKKYCTSPLQRHECIAYQDVVLKSSGAVLYSETIGFASAGRPGLTGFVLCVS